MLPGAGKLPRNGHGSQVPLIQLSMTGNSGRLADHDHAPVVDPLTLHDRSSSSLEIGTLPVLERFIDFENYRRGAEDMILERRKRREFPSQFPSQQNSHTVLGRVLFCHPIRWKVATAGSVRMGRNLRELTEPDSQRRGIYLFVIFCSTTTASIRNPAVSGLRNCHTIGAKA